MSCATTKLLKQRIKRLRKAKYTQQEMADKLFMSLTNYQNIENKCETDITVRRLASIALVLKVDIAHFFTMDDLLASVENAGKIVAWHKQGIEYMNKLDARVKSYE